MKAKGFRYGMLLAVGLGALLLSACSPPPPPPPPPQPPPATPPPPLVTKSWNGNYWGSIVINAPAEKVFAYLADPLNDKEWDPGSKEVEVEGSGLGMITRWKYDFGGYQFGGKSAVVDYVLNQKIVWKATWEGGFETATTLLVPDPAGTKLLSIVEYHIPAWPAALAKMTDAEIKKGVQEVSDGNLQRIKAAMEKP